MTGLALNDYVATGGEVAAIVETLRRDQAGTQIESEWAQVILRSMRPGSAGLVVRISGYEPYVPHAGTGSVVVDRRSPRHPKASEAQFSSTYRQTLAMSVPDQIREVLAALALNKSQLADVLGVTRPTLYDWLDGKEPNPANAERLATLVRLLARSGVTSGGPLNARFVRQPIEEKGLSLLGELKADVLDEERVDRLLQEARRLGEAIETRRRTREEKLRGLGYEEPSDEQRREQLNRNVASLDWPKR